MSEVTPWFRLKRVLLQIPGFRPAVWKTRESFANVKAQLIGLAAGIWAGDRRRAGPMRGIFSAYEELLAGRVPGRVIAPGQDVPPEVPGSVRQRAGLNQHGHQPWPIFWTQHRNARLVGPTLILLDAQNRGCVEAMYSLTGYRHDPAFRFPFHPPETHLSGNWTTPVARWGRGNFYHWLHDALPRFAMLDELPPDTRILLPPGLKSYETESLELLGLTDRVRVTTETNLVVDDYYFVSPTAMTGCYNGYGADFLRRALLPKGAALGEPLPKRFYITRRQKTRGIRNEAEVIQFFEDRGWAVLDLEGRTLQEQIALFAGAEAICGLHGAAMANLVWCQPGCHVLEIFASTFLNGVYEAIALTVGCDYHFRIYPGDKLDQVEVTLSDLRETVGGW